MQIPSLFFVVLAALSVSLGAAENPNILIITVDDMSCDSLGALGCELADTSPTVDALAESGMRFKYAHVVVGNCKPSRNVMWSGRYPHNSGLEGFYSIEAPDFPALCDLMKANGYHTGIRGKVSHSTPYHPYAWDRDLTLLPDGKNADMKDAHTYYDSTKWGIEDAAAAGKKFCLMINVSDPHKPFYAQAKGGETWDDPNVPSRVFTADEVPVPQFLADGPETRKELAHYYSSVRRADDCVAATLRALDDSGERENTFILFLSDHGMPLPFAKTQIYHHSTNTPLIAVWPGVTKVGKVDKRHMVSAVDFLPTLLDVAGIAHPEGLDGWSFLPVLRGEKQKGRDFVIKEHNENAGASRDPMRSVQTREFAYIYNPWSNGERIMATATQGTQTYREMQELAKTDEYVAGRLRLIDHRVPEEFYNYAKDLDGLHNLIDDPKYAEEIARHREDARGVDGGDQ